MIMPSKRVRAVLCASAVLLVATITATQAQEAAPKAAKSAGASKAAGKAGKAAAAQTPAVDPNDPAEIKRRAQPLVTYKGGAVTVGDIEDAVAHQSAFMRGRYRQHDALKELIDKTLRFSLLADEAARRGIDKIRHRARIGQAKRRPAPDQDRVRRQADAAGDSEGGRRGVLQRAHRRIRAARVAARRAHRGRDRKRGAEILAQVKTADLRTFHQLARDKSIDEASNSRGGDLRFFDAAGKLRGEPREHVPLPLVKAAFALKTDRRRRAQADQDRARLRVLKLTGTRPAVSRKLAEVEESIRVRLWRERRQQAIDAFVTALRAQYKPEIHAELVDAIVLDDTPSKG